MNRAFVLLIALILPLIGGCSCLHYWWNNDWKVGPNYHVPQSSVQDQWLEQGHPDLIDVSADVRWWEAFNDPVLNQLIELGNCQALSIRAAEARIRESRAQRQIAASNWFPQSQALSGQFARSQNSRQANAGFPLPVTTDTWQLQFDSTWEFDFWGRIRRSIDAADAQWQASIHDLDFARVSFISDVAAAYIQVRSFDERIQLARENVALQEGSLRIASARFTEGATSELDVQQAKANLALTMSLIPQLELGRRQSANAVGLLLGITPAEVHAIVGSGGQLPEIPQQLWVGIPAELLRRRPDVQANERALAAQFEQVGIAHADFYPQFALNGNLGWQAGGFADLFRAGSFAGLISPGFRWQILNFGRLENNVLIQEARVDQQLQNYRNSVLGAQREVEDGIIEFIKSKELLEQIEASELASRESVELVRTLYREGAEDFGRVFVVESGLVDIQDRLVQSRAAIALAAIKTYKAIGGGWEIRCEAPVAVQPEPLIADAEPAATDPIPRVARTDDLDKIESFRSGFRKHSRRIEIHGTEIIETTHHQ